MITVVRVAHIAYEMRRLGYYPAFLILDKYSYRELLNDSNLLYAGYPTDYSDKSLKLLGLSIFVTEKIDGWNVYCREDIPRDIDIEMAIENL